MQRCESIKHVLYTSRVVWDEVIAAGWLDSKSRSQRHDARGVDAFAAAGAMFPLVALVCSRSLRIAAAESRPHHRPLWAAAKAGSPSCVAWIVAHHRRGAHGAGGAARSTTVKEAAWVLCGLCASGNVEAARCMFGDGVDRGAGGTFPRSLWDGYRVPEWCHDADPAGLSENVASEVLEGATIGACASASVEAVKWLASALGIRGDESSWALLPLLKMALVWGNMDVAKWIEGECDLAKSEAPENVKWCVENFPKLPPDCGLLSSAMRNKRGTVELCEWLRAQFPEEEIHEYVLRSVKNASIGKWALSTALVEPSPSILNETCQSIAEVEFVEWLITERHFTPTEATFLRVCSTAKGGCSLPRWLSTRVKLGPADIQSSLECALRWNNTAIADWLESTFGVMGTVNSQPDAPGAMLDQICQEFGDYKDGLDGLMWFLQHLTHPDQISAPEVHKAITSALGYFRLNFVLHLLEVFPNCKPQASDTKLLESLLSIFVRWGHAKLQKLATLCDCSLFTREMVITRMTGEPFRAFSSKSVKWAITQFHLEDVHIKRNHNSLLYSILLRKKISCVEWLIDSFGITMDEVIEMFEHWLPNRGFFDIDLQEWKLIVRKFPKIDADVIRRHLMPVAVHSPSIATFTMSKFGITMEEMRHQFDDPDRIPTMTEYKPRLTDELMLWILFVVKTGQNSQSRVDGAVAFSQQFIPVPNLCVSPYFLISSRVMSGNLFIVCSAFNGEPAAMGMNLVRIVSPSMAGNFRSRNFHVGSVMSVSPGQTCNA
ncbi:hypothetical protein Pelo_16586 [Pelomyxa schiedti]|nr:hypothetical protein Pelo_16586 [Pelomyxa schiedti]